MLTLINRTARWIALLVAVVAPAVSGCQAPWAWGFLLAVIFGCAVVVAVTTLVSASGRAEYRGLLSRPFSWFLIAGLFTVLWSSGMCAYDHYAGVEGGRFPALSFRNLIFVWAFVAAFLLGLEWGQTERRLRWVLRLIFIACVGYAAFNVLQWCGIGPTEILGWTVNAERPSGPYTNANRFAVLLVMGWSAGAALFAARYGIAHEQLPGRTPVRRYVVLGAIAAGVVVISAGIAFTLSRLTIISTSVGLGVLVGVWWVKSREEHSGRFGARRSAALRFLPPIVVIVCSLVFLAAGLTLAGRKLGTRIEALSPSANERLRVMAAGAELMKEKPGLGWGTGTFETIFRPKQPEDLTPRFVRVHNDYLQVGIELGVPGLLGVIACTLAYALLWWRGLRYRGRTARFLLRLAAGLAIFVPLVCSVGDFPLREPATAMIYFLLAGAVAAALQRERQVFLRREQAADARPEPARSGFVATTALAVMAVVFVAFAIPSLRIGIAASNSPWYGRVMAPLGDARDVEGYREALKHAPGDPELLPIYAGSLVKALRQPTRQDQDALAEELAEALTEMYRNNPLEYRVHWYEASLGLYTADHDRVIDALERAVERAPVYRELRMQAAMVRIVHGVARTEPFTEARAAQLEPLIKHLRILLRWFPHNEQRMVDAMLNADVMPEELIALWPGDEPGHVISRARLWCGQGRWDVADRELAKLSGDAGEPWASALRGRVQLQWRAFDEGLAAWRKALGVDAKEHRAMERWIRQQIVSLRTDAVLRLASDLAEPIAAHPDVAMALARRLIRAKRLIEADGFLAVLNKRRPTAGGYRLWADLALRMKDHTAALAHAKRALQLSDHSASWNKWYDGVEKRVKGK